MTNQGSSFVPITANLEIANSRGNSMNLASGYGKWIEPGTEKSLYFAPPSELPSGEYILSLALKTFDDLPPTTRTFNIKLNAAQEKTAQVAASSGS